MSYPSPSCSSLIVCFLVGVGYRVIVVNSPHRTPAAFFADLPEANRKIDQDRIMDADPNRVTQLLKQRLERYSSEPLRHFIGGEPVPDPAGETFLNTTPIDNSTIGSVAWGTGGTVDLACQSSAAAFKEWRSTSAAYRKELLHRIADGIDRRAMEIAVVESYDTGQPLRFMVNAGKRGAANFRYFADITPTVANGQSIPTPDHLNYTYRQPIGPVGIITPWNTPFMLATWKIAPALASGCTVVHKPAEWSPYSASILAEIASDAGLPKGVLNVVHGTGESVGRPLTEHPLIKAIAFVGDTETGRRILQQGASTLKRVHFELGGKNPVIVFKDADLDRASDAVLFMTFSLNGQRCTSSSRLIVERSIHDRFIDMLLSKIDNLIVGNPMAWTTDIGPLISRTHLEKVRSYFTSARDEGARIVAGGSVVAGKGNFVTPTLIVDTKSEMRVAQEEIFGPVLTALTFDNTVDAVELANGVEYGLAAYVWTNDLERAHRVANALDVGMVWLNSENVRNLQAPFGGMKSSGIGRDGGDYSFDLYMETKNVCVAMGTHEIPKLGRNR